MANELPIPNLPMPNFKVEYDNAFYVTDFRGEFIALSTQAEIELLNYQFSVSPSIFQEAFEALHGFGEWKDHYQKLTPAHARQRMTRPPSRPD